MKLRTLALSALLVAGCAPGPAGVPAAPEMPTEEASTEEVSTAAAIESESSETAAEPEEAASSDQAEVAGSTQSGAPLEEPSGEAPAESEETSSSAEATAQGGWQVLDAEVRQASDIATLPVDEALQHYLRSRLEEPCDVEFTIYAVNGRFMVADESGTCAGKALMTYGPATGGEVAELVEFTQVQPCETFENEGLPPEVPQTEKFPDGLVCGSGERY